MNLQNKQEVFISWTGKLGNELAKHLRDHMFHCSPLKGWVSDVDITAGAVWFDETQRALARANFGVVCLTPGSSKKPWLNFETGFLFGQKQNCKLINFGEELINPLMQLQRIDGTNKNDWVRLLKEMTGHDQYQCEAWVESQFPKLQDKLRLIEQSPYSYMCQIDQTLGSIQDAVNRLKANRYALQNICFQKVILDSYQELYDRSSQVEQTYSIPASQYPQYLISLQDELEPKPHVKAIALVNIEERFWQQTLGKEILRTSRNDSVRVFVFTSENNFEITYPTLLEHARKYDVYAISLARLSEVLGSAYTKDFSIINASGSKLLAVYDDGLPEQKNIRFIAETRKIDEYEGQFDKLLKSSIPVPIPKTAGKERADIEQFMNNIFRGLEFYETRLIEMSEYINITDYDEHEEKHAYYQQMMQRMIDICLAHCLNNPKPSFDILELGAGTGIFTRRLLTKLTNITKIDVVEIDWYCYRILKEKLIRHANLNQTQINIHHEDSRTYDPPGKFDYIFSSFADHHIKTGDKEKYFENVKRNLKPGGLLIVGDEFIPEHDLENREARDLALKAYHNHIINIAEQQKEMILADLERAALNSGLEEKGDFKVSCTQYEMQLRNARFEFQQEKIGPSELQDVGGVYVYTAHLPT